MHRRRGDPGFPACYQAHPAEVPLAQLSPWLRWGHQYALAPGSDPVESPYPDILLASGRKSVGIALYVKKASGGKTFLAQLQDPRIDPKHFDLVVVPQHDPARGDNVLVTTGALHRITPEKLDAEKKKFGARLDSLPHPRVAVLIGGSSRAHKMTAGGATLLSRQLLALTEKCGAGLMVTASRRTGEENIRILRKPSMDGETFFSGTARATTPTSPFWERRTTSS